MISDDELDDILEDEAKEDAKPEEDVKVQEGTVKLFLD